MNVPLLVGGCVVVALSVLLWRHRESFAEAISQGQADLFGDATRAVQRAATGRTVGAVSLWFAVVGAGLVVIALFGG